MGLQLLLRVDGGDGHVEEVLGLAEGAERVGDVGLEVVPPEHEGLVGGAHDGSGPGRARHLHYWPKSETTPQKIKIMAKYPSICICHEGPKDAALAFQTAFLRSCHSLPGFVL